MAGRLSVGFGIGGMAAVFKGLILPIGMLGMVWGAAAVAAFSAMGLTLVFIEAAAAVGAAYPAFVDYC